MKLTSFPTYSKNPFSIDSRHIRTFTKLKKDKITGEVRNMLDSGDKQKHVRIFPEAFNDFKDLNSMAVSILGYIFKQVKEDTVLLSVSALAEELGVSARTTIYRGIADLLEKAFICRKAGTNIYFINPAKIYPGSRAKWFEKVNKGDDTDESNENEYYEYESD